MDMMLLLISIGFLLSLYAVYVRARLHHGYYKPLCNWHGACSSAFLGGNSHLFGVFNGILGIFYYIIAGVLYFAELIPSLLAFSIVGVFFSGYLSFQLVKDRTWCYVCFSVHLINLLLFLALLQL